MKESNMIKKKILIVDDEPDIAEILEFNLIGENFDVSVANSAEEAMPLVDSSIDLILLDVMMGGMSGYKMAEQLRKEGKNNPIIFITAKGEENSILTGFSLGADDYISKPFSVKEVIARVRATLRRSETKTANENKTKESKIVELGKIKINTTNKEVWLNNEPLQLTKTEYNILLLLMTHPEQTFNREEIINHSWGTSVYVTDRTVDVHITRLRKKLGEYASYIVNRLGYGYKLQVYE